MSVNPTNSLHENAAETAPRQCSGFRSCAGEVSRTQRRLVGWLTPHISGPRSGLTFKGQAAPYPRRNETSTTWHHVSECHSIHSNRDIRLKQMWTINYLLSRRQYWRKGNDKIWLTLWPVSLETKPTVPSEARKGTLSATLTNIHFHVSAAKI